MQMTIRQLANELGVSKTTINKIISDLGVQHTIQKVGNKYLLSETQILQLKHYRLKSVGFGAKAPIVATESRCQSKDLFARLKVCLSSTQVAVIPLP